MMNFRINNVTLDSKKERNSSERITTIPMAKKEKDSKKSII